MCEAVDKTVLQDPEHVLIYGQIVLLREDFVDLKKHVNDELELQKQALDLKAEKKDINLWLLWKQSPTWMKVVGAAVTAATVVSAAVADKLPTLPMSLF